MVDPDNRRPVDFAARIAALDCVLADLALDRGAALAGYARSWRDGRVKLAVTATLLGLRRDHPALFADGDYAALEPVGPGADAVCAFTRGHGEDAILVAVARFPGRREGKGFDAATGLDLPEGRWVDALTGRAFAGGAMARARDLFTAVPAAVLVRER